MAKSSTTAYTDTSKINQISNTLEQIFTCCVSSNTKDNITNDKPISIHEYSLIIEQIDKSTNETNELVDATTMHE